MLASRKVVRNPRVSNRGWTARTDREEKDVSPLTVRDLLNRALDIVNQTQPNEALITILLTLLDMVGLPHSKATAYWA